MEKRHFIPGLVGRDEYRGIEAVPFLWVAVLEGRSKVRFASIDELGGAVTSVDH